MRSGDALSESARSTILTLATLVSEHDKKVRFESSKSVTVTSLRAWESFGGFASANLAKLSAKYYVESICPQMLFYNYTTNKMQKENGVFHLQGSNL